MFQGCLFFYGEGPCRRTRPGSVFELLRKVGKPARFLLFVRRESVRVQALCHARGAGGGRDFSE